MEDFKPSHEYKQGFKEILFAFVKANRSALTGATLGLIVAILLLTIGFFKTFLIVLCVAIGWFLGKRGDRGAMVMGWLRRVAPAIIRVRDNVDHSMDVFKKR